jgi:hypothetical protein
LDYKLRLVFYPSILGWFLLGVWISKSVSDFFFLKRFIK